MNRIFERLSREHHLWAAAGALIAIFCLVLWWQVPFGDRQVGQAHITLGQLNEIVFDPPLEKLPSSYDFISVAIRLNFIPYRSKEYQDVFQTASLDSGMRLEVSPQCDISLIASLVDGPTTILLAHCEFDRPFDLEMAFDEKGVFRGTANKEVIAGGHHISKLMARFADFKYKNGYNGKRPFLGEILEFDLQAKFFRHPDALLAKIAVVAACLAGILRLLASLLKKHFLVAAVLPIHPGARTFLWTYWFVCSLGLIGILYGISRQLQLNLLLTTRSASYNQWALPWLFQGKPQELAFVAGAWIALFLYYITLYTFVPKGGGLNEFRVEIISNGKRLFYVLIAVLLIAVNGFVFAWFRAKNNPVLSITSFVLVLLWMFTVIFPLFALSDARASVTRGRAVCENLVGRMNQWVQSRTAFVIVASMLGLVCFHLAFIFSPFLVGQLKIINEYLDIPEYTYLGETLVGNTEYINSHQLAGLNKYDPLLDRGRTPTPRPSMYVHVPMTEMLESFINDHDTAYYYNDDLHALVVNRGMTSEEYSQLASIYPNTQDGHKIAQLFQTSRKEHRALMKREYTPTEMEFFGKNRFEMHNQILNRWVIHHHNFVLGPISEYAKGKPLNDINAQYGSLNVVIMANLLKWAGGISYANYFLVWYCFWLIYFALFVGCAVLLFRNVFYVTLVCVLAFGYIIMIDFQFLSLGPGLNPIRHFFDLPVLAALCMFIRKRKIGFLIGAVLFAVLGILNNVQFGLALAVALAATVFIMAAVDGEIVSVRTAAIYGGLAALLMIGIGHLLSAPPSGPAKNSMLTYYLAGFVGPPLSVNRLVWTMMAVSAAYFCLVYFEHSAKDTKYISMLLLFYSQGLFLYYTWGSTPPHILNIAPILVLCAVGFLKIFLEGVRAEKFQKLIVLTLTIIAICAVYIPASFAYYSAKQTFDNVFVDHKTYQWTLKTANFESTMDPQPFLDSVSLIKEFSGADPAVYIISKYDNFIPFLAEKYSAMPFFDVPWFLITTKELNLCIQRLVDSKPSYIFVDSDIERSLNGDIVVGRFPIEGNYEDGIGIESRMRVERLNLLKMIYSAIKDEYEPVKKGILLTAYKRKKESLIEDFDSHGRN
ncbi:hypothetical protein [Nitrospira sp. Nam74]